MAKKKDVAPRPFFEVTHEYEPLLRAYQNAANTLYAVVLSVIKIVADGGDPGKAIEALKPYAENFSKAAYPQEDKP